MFALFSSGSGQLDFTGKLKISQVLTIISLSKASLISVFSLLWFTKQSLTVLYVCVSDR